MGINMELEFDNYCKVGRSPRTVLPSARHKSKVGHKSRKEKPSSKNDNNELLDVGGGFTEIKFRDYRSISCKNLPSGDIEFECNEVLRRGSVYESSREREFRKPESGGGRKKIEFSLGSETSFSFGILDSICGLEEEAEVEPLVQKRSSVMSLNSDVVYSPKPPMKQCSLESKDKQSGCEIIAERDLMMENQKFKCDQVSGPLNNANVLKDKDSLSLNKSLSAKLALPHSPTHSERDSSKGSPKSRFTPIRKMFDPLTKSKSHRSPLSDTKSFGLTSIGRTKTLRKSLLHDFSSAVSNLESSTQVVNKDHEKFVRRCSPAHLNANLKMEHKHGVPYFEFSMANSEDFLVAKTWKAENGLNWVYTFHSIQGRKKINDSGWGIKYSNKDCPMVGQMQVSCYLCSELIDGGDFSNSMVTEFVLYDLPTSAADHGNSELSTPYPWAPEDLHPTLEIAAIVVQLPLEKRESLKHKRGDKLSHKVDPSLLDLSSVDNNHNNNHNNNRRVKLNVVTPLGNHGSPNSDESRGPSPLLDRWRLSGGCDCGGWDMGCPLVVFSNPCTRCAEEHSLLENDRPLKLYVQGAKETIPSLTITITEKGQYAVDFHAQLSTLQAFAVCVAILHTTEAFSSVEQEKNKQLLQCSSLKVLVEDEVKILVEAEERRKVSKMAEENPPSFVLNPPFSPIARV